MGLTDGGVDLRGIVFEKECHDLCFCVLDNCNLFMALASLRNPLFLSKCSSLLSVPQTLCQLG